jgi:hypothetical protein
VTLTRDPLSESFDEGARRLLDRAYARPGEWQHTRLVDPTPAELIRWRGHDPLGPDPVTGARYRTRWGRAFARALYYQHRWWSPHSQTGPWRTTKRPTVRKSGALLVEAGRYKPALGILPRGLSFRVMLLPAGAAMRDAVAGLPASQRWAGPAGHGPASSTLDDRDWGEDSPGHG